MRLKLRATSYDDDRECCTDFSWDDIKDDILLKFLKWSRSLEERVSLLNQNIKYFQEIIKLFRWNENAKKHYNTYLIIHLTNYSTLIAVEFGTLLEVKDELGLRKYIDFCKSNSRKIFEGKNVINVLAKTEEQYQMISQKYQEKLKPARDKVFAHSDKELINNDDYVDSILSKISFYEFNQMVDTLKEILDSIWDQYRSKKLFYEFDDSNDFDKIIDFLQK